MLFMEQNMRRPSKHRMEEHRMLNWIKHNKKLMVKGDMPAERRPLFQHLLSLCDKYRRINQYTQYHKDEEGELPLFTTP